MTFRKSMLEKIPELNNFSKLISVDLSSNKIKAINKTHFHHSITKISLEKNEIAYIARKAFATLVKLISLNLQDNKLIHLDLEFNLNSMDEFILQLENNTELVDFEQIKISSRTIFFIDFGQNTIIKNFPNLTFKNEGVRIQKFDAKINLKNNSDSNFHIDLHDNGTHRESIVEYFKLDNMSNKVGSLFYFNQSFFYNMQSRIIRLIINNAMLTEIPPIFNLSIVNLDLSKNKIKKLDNPALLPYTITELILNDNLIELVDERFLKSFKNLPQLF